MPSDKIKILHFVHSLNEGGIERLLLEICRKINRDKFEIQICCLYEKGIIAELFAKEGVLIHSLQAERNFSTVNVFRNISVLFKIIKIIRSEKINITHGHEFYSAVFSRLSGFLAGADKNYVTLHNMYYWWNKKIHFINRLLSHITDRIICNSIASMEYSMEHDQIDENKYLLIYNGIDCSIFTPDSSRKNLLFSEYNIDISRKIIMTVGSISHRKGYEYLIEAFMEVSGDYNELVLVIAGSRHYNEDDYYAKITWLIHKYGLNDRVIITGRRNDISLILNSCDYFIMTSVAEGFGLALAEAMASGKVCMVSDIPAFSEILQDNVNGYLFRSGDIKSIADTVRNVLGKDEITLDKIRQNARQRISENFSSEKMIKEYENLYAGEI